MNQKLDRRAQRAIEAFRGHKIVHWHDLPAGVGHKTMKRLIERGLIEVADENVGMNSKHYGWRLR